MFFFNMVAAATTWNFDKKFKFNMLGSEPDVECDGWNAEYTLKLKEVVNDAHLRLKWQTSPAAVAVKDSPFTDWLAPRTGVLRPLYWEISSEAYSNFKKSYEKEQKKDCFGVRRVKKLCQVSKGISKASRRLQVVLDPLKSYAYNHTTHISTKATGQRVLRNRENRVWSKQVNAQKDRCNHPFPYKGSRRGGTIEVLIPINKLEIPIPDWSCHWIPVRFLYMNVYVLQELNGMCMFNIVRHTHVE